MALQTLPMLRLGSALPFAKGPHCRFVQCLLALKVGIHC